MARVDFALLEARLTEAAELAEEVAERTVIFPDALFFV